MEDEKLKSTSVLRFVLAFLAVKLAAVGGLSLYTLATDHEPKISSTPITIAAVGVAMLWYAKAVNRPMTGAEVLRFSLGNTLADLLLSVAWLVGMIWLLGVPLNWEGVSAAMGGKLDVRDTQIALLIGLAVGLPAVFLTSAFFAWLLSKRLPRAVEPSVEEVL